MKNILKRLLAVLFTITLVFSLCSCSFIFGNTPPPQETTETKTTEEEPDPEFSEKLAALPDKDYGGDVFRIATDDLSLVLPDNANNIASRRLYERNAAVEKKYNIRITATTESGLPSISERLRSAELSGEDYCDMVLLDINTVQGLAGTGLLMNINSVPYLELDQSYYFERSINSMTFGGETWGVCGDFTYYPDDVYVLYFNQGLVNRTGLPDLYELASSNQWDYENFLLYSEEAYALDKVNGFKVYGYCSPQEQDELVNIFWASTGLDFVSNRYGERPQLIYNNQETRDAIGDIEDLLFHTQSAFKNEMNAMTNFKNGNCMFCIAPLSSASEISASSIHWGVLPIPKRDINQEAYYSYMTQDYQVVSFMKSTKDPIKAGMITNALFAASENIAIDRFLTVYLNNYLPNNESGQMVKLAVSTPYYDPAFFFGGIHTEYAAATYTLLHRVFSSGSSFNTLYNQYSRLYNRFLDENF